MAIALMGIAAVGCSTENDEGQLKESIIGAWRSSYYYDNGGLVEITESYPPTTIKFFRDNTFYISNSLIDSYGTYKLEGRNITTQIEKLSEEFNLTFYVWGADDASAYLTVKNNGELIEDVVFTKLW